MIIKFLFLLYIFFLLSCSSKSGKLSHEEFERDVEVIENVDSKSNSTTENNKPFEKVDPKFNTTENFKPIKASENSNLIHQFEIIRNDSSVIVNQKYFTLFLAAILIV